VTQRDEWSPDQPLGTETFEQGDEALDEEFRTNPNFIEEVEDDPSLEPTLLIDERELEEAGVEIDDPEELVSLDGGIDDSDDSDDSDGLDEPKPPSSRHVESDGWVLDESLTAEDVTDSVAKD
jgi:hypothetical protein